MDINKLIAEFKKINLPDSISPESLGNLLAAIVEDSGKKDGELQNALTEAIRNNSTDINALQNALTEAIRNHTTDINNQTKVINDLMVLLDDYADSEATDAKFKNLTDALAECVDKDTYDKKIKEIETAINGCATNASLQTVETNLDHKQPLVDNSADIVSEQGPVKQGQPPHSRLLLTDTAKHAVFDDLWKSAVGTYGSIDYTHVDDDGRMTPYMCNDVWMTYDEALEVYKHYRNDFEQKEAYAGWSCRAKTNIPYKTQWSGSYERFAQNNTFIVAARIPHIELGSLMQAFYGCSNLHTVIIDDMYRTTKCSGLFLGCANLVTVKLNGLALDISLESSPKISAESLNYICTHRYGTNDITITLHADVYNKITAAENEWAGLLDLAAEKHVTFACA